MSQIIRDAVNKLGRPFIMLWGGATVSLFGNALLSFALSVWVYEVTRSVLSFSGMLVATALPHVIILPFAGSFADRFDRRYILIISNCITAIVSISIALLIWSNNLKIWYLYTLNFISSLAGAFQSPTYQAAASASLNKKQMARGIGLMGASESIVSIFTPLLSGVLLRVIGLSGIVCIDLITFCFSTLFVIKAVGLLPPAISKIENSTILHSLNHFLDALSFFKKERLMILMLIYVTLHNCLLTLVSLMVTPLILANYSSIELGWVMTWGGLGGLIGSGIIIVKSDSNLLMVKFLICNVILSVCIMIAGGTNTIIIYSACSFLAMLVGTVGDCCSNTLWMRKVPLNYQGRVFALIGTIMTILAPVVAILGGFIADYIFEPALSPHGFLANSIGVWFGVGKGRGLGFVFVISGLLGILLSLGALLHKSFCDIDNLVPDGR